MDWIMSITLLQCLGLLLFLMGRKIRREIRRRRFKRTNRFGVQGYGSFNAYEYSSFFEGIIYLFGSLVRLAGILLMLLEWFANSL